jgi:hypothetical protein
MIIRYELSDSIPCRQKPVRTDWFLSTFKIVILLPLQIFEPALKVTNFSYEWSELEKWKCPCGAN